MKVPQWAWWVAGLAGYVWAMHESQESVALHAKAAAMAEELCLASVALPRTMGATSRDTAFGTNPDSIRARTDRFIGAMVARLHLLAANPDSSAAAAARVAALLKCDRDLRDWLDGKQNEP